MPVTQCCFKSIKRKRMSKINRILKLPVLGLLFALAVNATPLDSPYQPTKREWLRSEVSLQLSQVFSAWRQRIGYLVVVTDDQVIVTLAAANGEAMPSTQAQRGYVDLVRASVQGVLDKYQWARTLKVSVVYVP
jgi:hypothetical protein